MTRKTVLVNLVVEPETKELLKYLAKSSRCSVSKLLRSYVEPHLEVARQEDAAAAETIRKELPPELVMVAESLHIRPSVFLEKWWAAHQGEAQG